MTSKGEASLSRKLAVRTVIYSCLALFLAGALGERSLRKYHVSVPVLTIAAGFIPFL